jgi:hypothetical protein
MAYGIAGISGGVSTIAPVLGVAVSISQFAESAGNVVTLTVTGSTYSVGQVVYLIGLTSTNGSALNGSTVTLIAPTNSTTMTFNDPFLQGAQAASPETGTASGAGNLGTGLSITGDVLGHPQVEIFANGSASPDLIIDGGVITGTSGATIDFDTTVATGFNIADDSGGYTIQGSSTQVSLLSVGGIAFKAGNGHLLQWADFSTGTPVPDTSTGLLLGIGQINMGNGTYNVLIDVAAAYTSTTFSIAPQLNAGGIFVTSYNAFVPVTNSGASIGTTTIFTIPNNVNAQGLWRLTYFLSTHTAGSGSVTVTFSWTNGDTSVPQSATASVSLASTGNSESGVVSFYGLFNSNVTYSTTYAGTGSYSLFIRPEYLN